MPVSTLNMAPVIARSTWCLVEALRPSRLGLMRMQSPFPVLDRRGLGGWATYPCAACLLPSPKSGAAQRYPTRQLQPAPCKFLAPFLLHFSRCLESVLFCSHSAPQPNPFQYWLWATVRNETEMSVTYGKSDSQQRTEVCKI